MAETETITVAEVSDGFGGSDDVGQAVSLPVVELLTGRGFVTGKSGSGKSNSASVVAEKLLDNGFGILIIDIDGEYYGLKEEYEILHAGADEECDIQVTTDHADKLASLALERNVPIILDISSYLDESEAEDVLTAVSRSLFAKAKKQKQPFLMLIEEVHEYIPENGSVGECGKMLIKIGKRGRKHGLGICGISQRPADVKKDFITQCDWLLWHRLTWNNDTKVVRRILDAEHATAVENLDDGEGFLMTDWSESVRRVQFYRKQTFDAGATPGLDDFQRPDLKSVSEDLVSELKSISDEKQARDDRIAELREELDRKNSRIAELEKELQDARDLSRMADQFVDALVDHVEGPAPGKTERERMRESVDETVRNDTTDHRTQKADVTQNGSQDPEPAQSEEFSIGDDDSGGFGEMMDAAANGEETSVADADAEAFEAFFGETDEIKEEETMVDESVTNGDAPESDFSAESVLETLKNATHTAAEEVMDDAVKSRKRTPREEVESSLRSDAEFVDEEDDNRASENSDEEPLVVRELKADIGGLETKTRKMLAFYRETGPSTPLNAHFGAGGDGDRTRAYAHNRALRTRGLIEHVGRGSYDYRLRGLLREELESTVDDETIEEYAEQIEETVLDS